MHDRIVIAAVDLCHAVQPELQGAKLVDPSRVQSALRELEAAIREHHGGLPFKDVSALFEKPSE